MKPVVPMEMIDQELMRLKNRMDELSSRIIPDLENRTQVLYGHIMALRKDSQKREMYEEEYAHLSKELRLRSDEIINLRLEMENLEMEKNLRR
jgi:hypothetical protein